jgi:hypothetical protein
MQPLLQPSQVLRNLQVIVDVFKQAGGRLMQCIVLQLVGLVWDVDSLLHFADDFLQSS